MRLKEAESAGIHALLIDRTEKQQSDFKTIKNLRDVLPLIGNDILEE